MEYEKQEDDESAWPCRKCAGMRAHYLTCPVLRLPEGYSAPRGEAWDG